MCVGRGHESVNNVKMQVVRLASPEEVAEHVHGPVPFVVAGALDSWEARKWRLETLASQYGDVPLCVRLHPRRANCTALYEGECAYTAASLAEFIRWLQTTELEAAIGADSELVQRFPPGPDLRAHADAHTGEGSSKAWNMFSW